MKKIIIVAALLVAAFIGLALFNPWTHPNLAGAEPRTAVKSDGSGVYMAENRETGGYIYEVSRGGSVEYVYRDKAGSSAMRTAVTDLAVAGEDIYFIRKSGDSDDGAFRLWELVRLNPESGEVQTIYSKPGAEALDDIRVTSAGGGIYLSFIKKDGLAAEVYRLNPEASKPEPELVTTAAPPQGQRFVSLVYSGTKIFGVLSNGRAVEYTYAATQPNLLLAGGVAQGLSFGAGGVFFADALDCEAYGGADGVVFRNPMPSWVQTVISGAAAPEGGFVSLVRANDGEYSLLWHDGGKFSPAVSLYTAPTINLSFSLPHVGAPVVWAFGAAAFAVFALAVCVFSRKYFIRLTAVFACVLTILPSFAIAVIYTEMCVRATDEKRELAYYYANERVAQLGDAVFAAEPVSDERVLPALALQKTGLGNKTAVKSDLLAVRDGMAYISASGDKSVGIPQERVYGKEVSDAVTSAHETKTARSVEIVSRGAPAIAVAVPIVRGGETAVLLTFVSMSDVAGETGERFDMLIRLAGAVSLGGLAVVVLLTAVFTRPLGELLRRMDEIAEGRFDQDSFSYAKSEIGQIQRAMQEMCVSLSIKDHETRTMLSSYYRFVPHGVEKLLDRASVMEIDCGDSAARSGNVGILTVNNREWARARLNDSQFMDYVNRCFDVVYEGVGTRGALFLSGDFGLSGLPLLFPGAGDDGVGFGLDIIGMESAYEQDGFCPDFSVLLHSAGFLYGVAGKQEKAFPFLSSSELDFLTVVSARISALGVKIVVTEQYLQQSQSECSSRYIGFISSPDGRYTFKLYEVLDACLEQEKQLRLQYDGKFQEAIRLFYKNDFYLARNIFSSLFKTCPDDAVARWYIFACERFFNSADLTGVSYGIFGVEEQA